MLPSMNTQTIYIIVGGKVREAQARIVGKIAEVMTEVGIREFGQNAYHLTREAVERKLKHKPNAPHEGRTAALSPGVPLDAVVRGEKSAMAGRQEKGQE